MYTLQFNQHLTSYWSIYRPFSINLLIKHVFSVPVIIFFFPRPDCRVCQWHNREFLNKKILAHLGAVYSKFCTLFWPKTLYLHCILQGFYHFSFFGWLSKRNYKYFCAPAPQCFAFVYPRSRRKVPYSTVWFPGLTDESPKTRCVSPPCLVHPYAQRLEYTDSGP